MTGFDILTNFIDNLEALLKRTRAKLKKVSALGVRRQSYKVELNTRL
jgi:hypothetical protein